MNINDLKIFEAVASTGSFTKAAKAMFTVQSNVTARIKNLEDEFNASLFERTSRKVVLTPAGQKLMKYSKQIGSLIALAHEEISDRGSITGYLKIGCIETTMALKVPQIIRRFADTYPKIVLEFISEMQNDLVLDVLGHKLDAAFVSAPISTAEIEQVKITEDRLVILAPRGAGSLSKALSSEILKIVVFDNGCVFRARLESLLSAKGLVQYQNIIVNSIEGIINFVEAGLGISILPAEIIAKYYQGRSIETFAINDELSKLTTLLIYPKGTKKSGAIAALAKMFTDNAVQEI